jgi:NADPH:quinone reductase-like Zn-dependent oxidoreductase
MQALVRDHFGSSDVLDLRDVPKPVPRPDEVLVKVRAASLNDWDLGLLQGTPFMPNRLFSRLLAPRGILGSDIAGRVEAVGDRVTRFAPGDDVYGDLCRSGFGGFAEYVCARQKALARKPAGMSYEQAAAIPQAGMLAVQGLLDRQRLRPGHRLLVNGAGGGVGTFAIQLARLPDFPGVEITGVDSGPKLDLLRSMGCAHVVDYQKEDFTARGQTYDLILDAKTNRSPFDYARALTPGGTYATVGGPSHLLHVTSLGPWIRWTQGKRIVVVGLVPNRDLTYLNELFEAGRFAPIIDGPYPLSAARDAFQRLSAGAHVGKIIFTIGTP